MMCGRCWSTARPATRRAKKSTTGSCDAATKRIRACPWGNTAGALTLDVAGKRAAATAAGIVDGAGYTAATLVGVVLGRVADRWGWPAVFDVIAATGGGALLLAAAWWARSPRREAASPSGGWRA